MSYVDDFLYGGVVLKGYVFGVIGTVLLSAIIAVSLPEGKTSVTVKSIARGLCVLIIVSPVLSFFPEKTERLTASNNAQTNFLQIGIQTDESFIQYFSNVRVQNAQAQLENELQERFGLPLSVLLVWEWQKPNEKAEYEDIYISKIQVQGTAEATDTEKRKILDYLTKNYCSEVLLE